MRETCIVPRRKGYGISLMAVWFLCKWVLLLYVCLVGVLYFCSMVVSVIEMRFIWRSPMYK